MGHRSSERRKVTLLLQGEVATALRNAVESGAARSQSELVEHAVSDYLAARERDARARAYADASNDPEFIEDLEAVQRDFARADDELEDA
jgi:Arc/MetJ-type ribon-helix-helix transcriptional regulator